VHEGPWARRVETETRGRRDLAGMDSDHHQDTLAPARPCACCSRHACTPDPATAPGHHAAAAATLARRILLLLRDITPEGKWTANDEDGTGLVVQGQRGFQRWQGTIGAAIPDVRYPRTPCKVFASHEELRQAAVNVLLGRGTVVRRRHPVFQELFHPPDFARLHAEPQVNFQLAIALWLEAWESRFWAWHRKAACEFGICRVPTNDDFDAEQDIVSEPGSRRYLRGVGLAYGTRVRSVLTFCAWLCQ